MDGYGVWTRSEISATNPMEPATELDDAMMPVFLLALLVDGGANLASDSGQNWSEQREQWLQQLTLLLTRGNPLMESRALYI